MIFIIRIIMKSYIKNIKIFKVNDSLLLLSRQEEIKDNKLAMMIL